MSGLWDLASVLFGVGTQVVASVKNGKLAETDEFKAEVEEIKKELEKKSDYEMLIDFNEAYCKEGYGSGLYHKRNFMDGLDADSTRMAYMKILGSSRFQRLEFTCPECELRLGSRFMPVKNSASYDKARKCDELTLGQWYCFRSSCGRNGTWKVEGQGDDLYLGIVDY